jgi:hypothetical protein
LFSALLSEVGPAIRVTQSRDTGVICVSLMFQLHEILKPRMYFPVTFYVKKIISYLTENTLCLLYKNQLVSAD